MSWAERIAAGSIGVGCLVLALKAAAWWLTGSAALYSDALESTVNVAGSAVALWALRVAAKPADADHPYGHDKAEFFAAVIDGRDDRRGRAVDPASTPGELAEPAADRHAGRGHRGQRRGHRRSTCVWGSAAAPGGPPAAVGGADSPTGGI